MNDHPAKITLNEKGIQIILAKTWNTTANNVSIQFAEDAEKKGTIQSSILITMNTDTNQYTTHVESDKASIRRIIAKHWNTSDNNVHFDINHNTTPQTITCIIYPDLTNETDIITKTDIKDGIKKETIKFIIDPNMNAGTVCQIGEYWFYFGGITAEEENPETYVKNVPIDDIVESIYDVLEDFRQDEEFQDEYAYYRAYLSETT